MNKVYSTRDIKNMKNKMIKKAVIIAAFLCLIAIYVNPKPLFEKPCNPKEMNYEQFTARLDSKGKLTVYNKETKKFIFESDANIYVYDFIINDITADGSCDLLFVLWKHGSFGESRPLWKRKLEISDLTKSSHLFAYSFKGKDFHSIWCSSALSVPIKKIVETGKCSAQATPIIYMPIQKNQDKKYAEYWYWSGWGFRGYSEIE